MANVQQIIVTRKPFDWSKLTPDELFDSGWPAGMDGETAAWLTRKVREALQVRPMSTVEIWEHLKNQPDKTKLWARTTRYSWADAAIVRAANDVDAEQKWMLQD